ncbi:hypothetical protein CP960_07005 [Malaciobacter halophilus]|uniref:Lipoprotein n=1 Tax=Malaciobacter halophilus TaxID=197482 RepID=A0A2N1J2F6_9BACT|nr:hypothetical protein [Malaciobacter halophilus]AXH09934.1 hypothetical protein AHALO_1566 [Malaciobacter halophilus]PKI80745.1 hypothetical protein CP960_07005 [Malaciobacter halophilus]
MIKNLLILGSILLFLNACSNNNQKQQWTSWIYPDKNHIKRSMKNGVYNSLEECKQASINKIEELNISNKATYKCGLNCSFHEGMKTEICQKMTK